MINAALFFTINTIILFFLSTILENFKVENISTAILFLIVLTFLNWTIIPLLKFLTLPINLISLGLISFLLNLFGLWLATALVEGISITSSGLEFFFTLLIISISLSIVSPAIRNFLEKFTF
jgi:putative membrane protein